MRLNAAGHVVSSCRAPTPAPIARGLDIVLAVENRRASSCGSAGEIDYEVGWTRTARRQRLGPACQ
ncbi:MAG: hypothetical protein E5W53_01735 [Mesorhizobium sp.]|nr:MAG: hypothetical protein E5W53_01735 [Mesorhizobium sp.]